MQAEYPILYLEINAFSLILVAIILKKTSGLSKMVAQRNFAMSIIAEMVFFSADTLYVLINDKVLQFGSFDNIAKLMCKEIYFFSTALMCFFWFLYFEYLRNSKFVRERKNVPRSSIILWAVGIMLFINIFTGFLFYIAPDGSYHRGDLFILTYISPYTYVAVACIRTIRDMLDKSYHGEKHGLIALALFPIAPAAAGILQFAYPRLPVACGVLALATLLMYLNWIDQLISLDPLTGLNNRKQLIHSYDQMIKNRSEYKQINLMMIDANKFKSINDTYGHVQGDLALKNIAEALKEGSKVLSKRAKIARYGGDEFAILFETDEAGEAALLKKAINEQLGLINKRSGIDFDLTVSTGCASTNVEKPLKELISEADEAMYEEKEALKRKKDD